MVDGKETNAEIRFDKATRSTIVKLSAAPTAEIRLLITGDTLITDNGDLIRRCSDLLQKMQLDLNTKMQTVKILEDPKNTYPVMLRKLIFNCAKSAKHQAVIEALMEQITLTES